MYVDNLTVHNDDLGPVVGYFRAIMDTPVRGVEVVPAVVRGDAGVFSSVNQGLWTKTAIREERDANRRISLHGDKTTFIIPDEMVICGDFIMRSIPAYLDMRDERPSIRTPEADRRAELFTGTVNDEGYQYRMKNPDDCYNVNWSTSK